MIHDVIAILKVLALEDLDEEDYHPYDGTPRPPGHLDPSVGAKGLRTAGEVPVPPDIWKKYAPAGLSWVLANLPDQGETKDEGLEALATRMCQDGLLIRDLQGGLSTFRAFAKSKSATKGALIADLRALNSALVKPVPFKLPSLSQLGHLFSVCKAIKLKLFFTKLDISNMYRACKVLAEFRNSIRFRVNGTSYFVPSLPLGWAFSPIIAIEIVARYLSLQHPGQVILIQYLDDVLLASVSLAVLRSDTTDVARDLMQGRWVVSPKLVVEPDTCITWLGKKIVVVSFPCNKHTPTWPRHSKGG